MEAATETVYPTREYGRCTIYTQGEFGFAFKGFHAKSATVTERPYAQYPVARHVKFLPPRARRFGHSFVSYDSGRCTNRPYVIVEGYQPVELGGDTYGEPKESCDGLTTVRESLGTSFDPIYNRNLAEAIERAGLTVLERHGV